MTVLEQKIKIQPKAVVDWQVSMEVIKKFKRYVLPLIILLTLLEIFLVYLYVSKPQLVAWDEANYILEGYNFRLLIKKGDWRGFWNYSRWLVRKPFFHGWYVSWVTLPFNYSVNTARLACLALLLPTVLILWILARKVDRKKIFLPILTVGLLGTSPTILFLYSTAMRESLSLLLTLTSLWLYLLARKKEKLLFFFLTALNCLALFFIKYHYLTYVFLALGVESLIWLTSQKNWQKTKVWLSLTALFLPIVVASWYWVFLLPGNFPIIRDLLFKSAGIFRPSFIAHVFFYLFEMAFGYTFSWLAFLILLIGFLWALVKHHRHLALRTLAWAFLFNFFFVLIRIHKNQARYLFTTFPAFFLVGAVGTTDLLPKLKKALKSSFIRGLTLLLGTAGGLVMIYGLILVPMTIKPIASHHCGAAIFYEQDYQNVDYQKVPQFNFNRRDWPHVPPPKDHERVEDIVAFILENINVSKTITPLNWTNELNPHILNFYVEQARQQDSFLKKDSYSEYFVVYQITPGSRFDTWDYRRFNYQVAFQANQSLADPNLIQINQKNFPYLGATVTILGKI